MRDTHCIHKYRVSRNEREREKDHPARRLATKIACFGVNDRGEISPCSWHARRTWCRAWLTQFREMMQRRDQLRHSPHIHTYSTVGNSPPAYNTRCCSANITAREYSRVATSLKKTFRYRVSAALLLLSARTHTRVCLFRENASRPRSIGTRSGRKCQPRAHCVNTPAHERDPPVVAWKFPIYRVRLAWFFQR